MNFKKIHVAALTLVIFLLGVCPVHAEPSADPKALLEKMDTILRGKSHQMSVSMHIKTKSWKRDYKIKVWMNGIDQTMARVISPAKVEGQGFLRTKTKLWNYLPSAERTLLIPPSMMLDRFMGSDFSNDDFVKMSYFPRDYEAKVANRQGSGPSEILTLELTPKKDAPVTYGKLVIRLKSADAMPLQMDFYNEDLEKIRELRYSEVKDFGGHALPAIWEMTDLREKNRQTTIKVEDAVFDKKIPDKIFSQANLEKYP